MQRPRNRWPSTSAGRGTLFFAQALRASVDDGSYEGFRAYSLDTLGRLKETHSLADDVLMKRVNKAALKPALDELHWSLDGDDAAQEIAQPEIDVLLSVCKDQPIDIRSLKHALVMVLNRLAPKYRNTLRDLISKSVMDDGARGRLLKATNFLASHLINEDHSKNFLIDSIDEKFF